MHRYTIGDRMRIVHNHAFDKLMIIIYSKRR